MYLPLTFLSVLAAQANSYILLQVRRDAQNRSNVDALIHKVVAPGKFDELVSNIARKQFTNQEIDLSTLKDIHMKINDREPKPFIARANNVEDQQRVEKESGESGEWVPDEMGKGKDDSDETDGEGEYEEAKSEKPIKPNDNLQPFFRARGIELKPEVINFRTKPSLMYELNSNNIARMMNDFLSSKTVVKYMDKMAKRAAEYYEAFRSSK